MPRIIVLPDADHTYTPAALLDERVSAGHLNDLDAAVPFLTRLEDAIQKASPRRHLAERIVGSAVAGYARALR